MRGGRIVLVCTVALAAGGVLVGPLGAQTKQQLKQARKLLDKLTLVDGAGSNLDADTLQGGEPSDFLAADAQAVDSAALGGASASEVRATGIHVEAVLGAPVALDNLCVNIMSCTIANPSNSSRNVVVQAMANVRLGHTNGMADAIELTLAAAPGACASPATNGEASVWFNVVDTLPTGCCFATTLHAVKTFPINAVGAATFYLTGRLAADSGASVREVVSGNIQCTVVR